MLVTVKSVGSTVASMPLAARSSLACSAMKSWTAVVTVPMEAVRSSSSPWAGVHGAFGYLVTTGYSFDATWIPAPNACQCGSVPRGPRLVGVSRPWDQNPNAHSDDRIIIQPNSAVARTRYPMRGPNIAASSRYTLPTKSITAMATVSHPTNGSHSRPGPQGMDD